MRIIWDLPLSPDGIDVEVGDGRIVRIRPVRTTDRDTLLRAFDRLSAQSRYQRFFTPMKQLPEALATKLTDIDHHHHLAWAVADPNRPSEVGDGSGFAIGVARLILDEPDPSTAEAALALVDEYQRQGIGRFLIELLVCTAAQLDVEQLRFEVLSENRGMRGLLRSLGATTRSVPGDPTVVQAFLTVPSSEDIDVAAGSVYELLRRQT